jgi:hypothetical protein
MRSRTVLGAAAWLCLVLGAAACAGDDDGESEEDLVEQLSETLQAGGELDQETADCFAEVAVDEVGVEELQDLDLSADEPSPELQEAIAAAALSATEECGENEPE